MLFNFAHLRKEKVDGIQKDQYMPLPLNEFLCPPKDRFFSMKKFNKCRFCASGLSMPTFKVDGDYASGELFQGSICEKCGWWFIKHSDLVHIGGNAIYNQTSFEFGILRKYASDSIEIPLNTLRQYVAKNPNILYKIHYTKMEQLVGDVFKDFFDCEVIHVGGTGDGGIDLLLIKADSEFAVQVKRRTLANKVETVEAIREFVGAMVLSEKKLGIFVTTAKSFSEGAMKSSSKLTSLSNVPVKKSTCMTFKNLLTY